MTSRCAALALTVLAMGATVNADSFVNGGFDNGSSSDWTIGSGSRNGRNLSSIDPSSYLNGASPRSAIVSPGLDPELGALLPDIVFAGPHSYRLEDSGGIGGHVSAISQTVNNYTDSNIFFTWIAALENGGHTAEQSAAMIITLKDLTAGDVPISRIYKGVPGVAGVDDRWSYASSVGFYYTPEWQIEQLVIDNARLGHSFELTVLAADCGPTGHSGYVYLDGFDSVPPPPVPEPSTLVLFGSALVGLAARLRKHA